jgi:class 3 adenylate cyclase/pimeloyl-ACP methyl ester carboxylesterase
MEPAIRYAPTADGVSIAYYDVGEGAPLVVLPNMPWSNIQSEFSHFPFHPALASSFRLIRYDLRGAGLSQRGVSDFSLAALQLDLDGVLNRLEVRQTTLYAEHSAAIVALAYAAAHPERIHRIVLWAGLARASDFYNLPRAKAAQSLLHQPDWELYTEMTAQLIFGFSGGEESRWYAAFMRDCISADEARAYFAAGELEDVTHLLSQVTAPTLLLYPSDSPIAPRPWGQQMASVLPHAELKIFPTDVVWSDEIGEWIIQSATEFLTATTEDAPAAAAQPPAHAFQTILFTDMERSTANTQRLGDAAAHDFVRTHNILVREALRSHGGREIKHTGDGIMAAFASPSAAVSCAIDVQRAVARMNDADADAASRLKIGVNAGEPVAEDDDLFGTAVQLARRICDHAAPEQILVPEGVRHLVAGKNFLFADAGETALRGFEDPVRLYEVRWQE